MLRDKPVNALFGTAIGVLVYGSMLLTAHWWYGHFRFGPAEWVWRSITYGPLQVMRQRRYIVQGAARLSTG